MLAETKLQADWLSHYLFESPWLIIAGLAIVWTAMRIIGRRRDSKTLKRASWAPLVLIVALWAVSAAVTTRQEQLLDALDRMLLSVEDRDFASFRQTVAPDAVALFPPRPLADRFTRDQIESRVQDFEVRDILLLQTEAAMVGEDEAVTVIVIRAQGNYAGIAGLQKMTWAIQWRFADGRWQAYDLECTDIGFDAGKKDKPPT